LTLNTTLANLNLWCNPIGDSGAASLAQALTTNTTLLYLGLSYDTITEQGISELIKALKINTTLLKVSTVYEPEPLTQEFNFLVSLNECLPKEHKQFKPLLPDEMITLKDIPSALKFLENVALENNSRQPPVNDTQQPSPIEQSQLEH